MTDILICPCINLFWKAVRPCKEERWSSFSQCADRVLPSHRHTRALCTSSPRLSSPRSVPPVPSWSTRKVVYSFVFHSYNKIQLLFFSLPGFLPYLNQCLIQFCSCQVFVYKAIVIHKYFQGRFYSYDSRHLPPECADPETEWRLSSCIWGCFRPVLYNLQLWRVSRKLLVSAADLPRNFPFLPHWPAPPMLPPLSLIWHLAPSPGRKKQEKPRKR